MANEALDPLLRAQEAIIDELVRVKAENVALRAAIARVLAWCDVATTPTARVVRALLSGADTQPDQTDNTKENPNV